MSGRGPATSAGAPSSGGGRGRGKGRGRGGKGRGRGAGDNSKPGNNDKPNSKKVDKKGGRGSGNRRNRGRGRGKAEPSDSSDKKQVVVSPEEKKAEEERIKKEEEDKALAEAEAKRLAEIQAEVDRRAKLQKEYDTSVNTAIDTLEQYANTSKLHSEIRSQLDPSTGALTQERKDFEKKKGKSDLKKCTAFVKKIKAGTYPTTEELSRPNSSIKSLNLTRYVEEVAAALLEPATKVKQSDVPGMTMVCVEMHRRYDSFLGALVPGLMAEINGKGNDGLPRRICFRLLTEFLLHGVLTDPKPIVKVVNDAAGVPSVEGKDYAVSDANLIVTLAKCGGNEILGVVPKSIQCELNKLKREVDGKGEGALILLETSTPASEEAKEGEAKPSVDISAPFQVTLSTKLRDKAQATIELFNANVPFSHAVAPNITSTLHKHCIGAYQSLANSYVSTHVRLGKLEKRCEQDRLLQGTLSEAREKGLADARSLMESLTKTVQTLSEALDVTVPVLKEESAEESEESTKGIELWTKSGVDGDEKLGPFDDEETRSFYCDVPDLLSIKPPALLGINPTDLEAQKEKNSRKYGNGDENVELGDIAAEVEVGDETMAKDDDVVDDKDDDKDINGSEAKDDVTEENKDTPHYKLMVLLEQELPETSRREAIDELADRFCSNHGSNRKSRKRLYETLFLVPRTRLDLLPYYSRFACIMDRVYSDSTLVEELERQMHGQAIHKKNQNIESRLRTVRYVGELTKFRVAPPMVALRGLRRCIEDFSGNNIDVACCLLESCGRYLYRTKHTHAKISELMEAMMRIKKARNLDERHVSMITSAFMMVNPPAQSGRQEKEVPPLEAYLRYLTMSRLDADEKTVAFVSKQIQRLPWSDPSIDCGALVCKYMLKACRKGRYRATKAVGMLAMNLKRTKPEVPARLVDDTLEEIQWFIEHPSFRDSQRTLVSARLLGELYTHGAIPSSIIFDQLLHILNYGHDIPDALRHASENQELFAPRGNISQTIMEDEELEEEEDEPEKEEEARPRVVLISPFSKYDPRVRCKIDPPNAGFRIKLFCTCLESASGQIVTASNRSKIEFILASLQRYLFTKTSLPSDAEFSVLDLFDALDSKLKSDPKTKKAAESFVRYSNWFDAHQFVVKCEQERVIDDARASARLLAQAGLLGAEDSSIADATLLEEEMEGLDLSDGEESVDDKGSVQDNSDDDDSMEHEPQDDAMDADDDDEESDDDDDDDDDSDYSDGDDEMDDVDEAEAEAAYTRQLEDEAFEAELRRLTMDAIEKGKVTSKSGGAKVSSQMPVAPQFAAKKAGPADDAESPFGADGMSFKLFKRGNKGRQEEVQFVVPRDNSLAQRATRQDDEAAKERELLKARALQYARDSAEAGGNVYLDEKKLEVNRNKKLTMETLEKNFGKETPDGPYKMSSLLRGRGGGRGGRGPGRGRGRGGGGRGWGGGVLFCTHGKLPRRGTGRTNCSCRAGGEESERLRRQKVPSASTCAAGASSRFAVSSATQLSDGSDGFVQGERSTS